MVFFFNKRESDLLLNSRLLSDFISTATTLICSFSMIQKQLFIIILVLWEVPSLFAQNTGTPSPKNPPIQRYPQFAQPPNVLEELKDSWNLSIGMDIGASELYHQIDFERTPLLDFYNSIKAAPSHSDYEWETFVVDYDLKKSIKQPRFGFSALLTYGNIPAFIKGEFISSTSSYQKMTFTAMAGIGKDIVFGNDYFASFKGGYKIIFQDAGFGAKTIVNSIGNEEARKYMERFFDPESALGPPRGDMMSMRCGFGKYMGPDRKTCLGMEIYGDLDLTSETRRIAKMNALGLNVYVSFVLF